MRISTKPQAAKIIIIQLPQPPTLISTTTSSVNNTKLGEDVHASYVLANEPNAEANGYNYNSRRALFNVG